jgi:hypothetical protein
MKKKVLDIGPSGFLAPQGEKSKRILYPEPSPIWKRLCRFSVVNLLGILLNAFFLFFVFFFDPIAQALYKSEASIMFLRWVKLDCMNK